MISKFRKYFYATAVAFLLSIGSSGIVIAQGPPDPSCDPLDPACPIDGGLSLLIAAGIGIGAKKTYDLRKKESQN